MRLVDAGPAPLLPGSSAAGLATELGVTQWQRDPSEWPVTSLPANEAVHAAKEQSAAAAEQPDMALRRTFWRDSRCISTRHEILDVAAGCDRVDVDCSDEHNPGIGMHQEGEPGAGFLVVDEDDPAAYDRLVRRAAGRPA